MGNKIKLLSISELLERNFFIPSYQRGYRWEKQQVNDLLNDIYRFAIKPNKAEKEFYCLQPIVVKRHKWEKVNVDKSISKFDGWEVIDGQQRITTIRIILAYLIRIHLDNKSLKDQYGKSLFTLDYETRDDTEIFLNNINEDNDEYIDYYHISMAFKYIREWFESKDKQHGVRSSILNTLVYDYLDTENPNKGVVQVIWYEIDDESVDGQKAIDTFIRINLGRIPLTNSELIKALFLQEREFYKEKEKEKENEIAKLKQLEIATEWDRIERSLQNDDFWSFLNETENDIPARIEFIFDLICKIKKNEDPTLEAKIGNDRYATFRYFNQSFDKQIDFKILKDAWESIRHYFLTLEEWFNNPVWYHYIGFLIYSKVSILEIYNLTKNDFETNEEIKTKDEITLSIKKKIKDKFKGVKWSWDVNKIAFIDISYGKDDRQFIREVLLLLNIEYIVKQCEAKTLIYKFPFKTFKEIKNVDGKKQSWDIEHIDSFSSNKLPSRENKIEWLQFALIDLKNEINENLKKQIIDYIENEKTKQDFEYLRNQIIQISGETITDEEVKNNIGNLTLLDAGTNRGYGNALFPTKRRKIIEKDKLGVFIPYYTKNVFLKYFDKNARSNAKWSIEDIIDYRGVIAEIINEFLPQKPLKINDNE